MKYMIRVPFCDEHDSCSMESWLHDQAKKGWVLDKMLLSHLWFRREAPTDIQYRIEPAKRAGDLPSEEMKEYYADAGWKFMGIWLSDFYLWQATRADAEELHTDTVVQGFAYEQLLRSSIATAILIGIVWAGMIAMTMKNIEDMPQSQLYDFGYLYEWVIPLLFFLTLLETILSGIRLRQTKKKLALGIPMDHNKDYKKEDWLARARKVIWLGVFVFASVALIILRVR